MNSNFRSISLPFRILLLVSALQILPGCAVGPDYAAPEIETPEAFLNPLGEEPEAGSTDASAGATHGLERWWEYFADPGLNELVAHAVGTAESPRNLDLKIAMERVLEARGRMLVVQAPWFPDVSGNASFQRSRISPNSLLGSSAGTSGGGFSFLPGLTNNLFNFGFDAIWELDIFGGTRRAVEAQEAETEATEENYNQVLLTLIAEIARNYVEYRSAHDRIEAIDRNIKVQEESVSLTRSRFNAGMTSQLDVFQAEAQAANTESQKPLLQIVKDQAANRLAVLLGEYPQFIDAFFAAHPGKVPEDLRFVPRAVPSELLRKRPDVRSAERQLAAASARIGVATAQFFPTFSVAVAGSLQSRESENWLEYASRSWSLFPQVSIPIFQGGAAIGNLRAADAQEQAAFAAYRQIVLTSVEEVENATSQYRQYQERYRNLFRAFTANQQSMEISQKLYVEGLADFLRVLEAQRSLNLTEDFVIATKAARVTSLIALFKALGGGLDAPPVN